jgi:hypothetical protein
MRPPEMGKEEGLPPLEAAYWAEGRRKLRSVNFPKRLWL